jgi:hypothetical protein
LRTAFSVPPAQVADKRHSAGTVTDDGNYAVLTVTEVRNGDPATEPAEEKLSRRRVAERQLGNEEFAAYIAEAERNVDVVKNPTVFD